jgi:hypothetical protein
MSQWIGLAIIVGVQLVISGVSYGILRGSVTAEVDALKANLLRMETNVATFVTRSEYESRHGDLKSQLARIEDKLDKIAR